MKTNQKVIIVGAGIGGLTAALCFRRLGWEVIILEKSQDFSNVGGGIQIAPNGMKCFDDLGVAKNFNSTLFEPSCLEMRTGKGNREIFKIPIDQIAERRWQAKYINIRRIDLIKGLSEAMKGDKKCQVHFDSQVVAYQQDRETVGVVLNSGKMIEGDLLIGADGVHSVVRAQMLKGEAPLFSGYAAWRLLIPTTGRAALASPNACVWVGRGRHISTTHIRGGDWINFVGVVEQPHWSEVENVVDGSKEELQKDYFGWNDTIMSLIDRATVFRRWKLWDHTLYSRWSEGRVVLLGDACHPLLPTYSQGASQAVEDAWVLADSIQRDGLELGVTLYRPRRFERIAMIQKKSAQNMRLFHRRGKTVLAMYAALFLASRSFPGLIYRQQDVVFRGCFSSL